MKGRFYIMEETKKTSKVKVALVITGVFAAGYTIGYFKGALNMVEFIASQSKNVVESVV